MTTSQIIVDKAATLKASLGIVRSSNMKIKRKILVETGVEIAEAIRILKECQQLIIDLPESLLRK